MNFKDQRLKSRNEIMKKNQTKPDAKLAEQNQKRNLLKCPLVYNISWTSTIHSSISLGRALLGTCRSVHASTIMSHEQFKPVRIRNNLVVNYKKPWGIL